MNRMGWRWAGWVALVGWLALTGMARAEDLVIPSYSGDGVVGWTYPTNGVTGYRIEWVPDLISGKWKDLESGLRGIQPTNNSMSVAVPMFYRIRAMNEPPADMVYIPPGTFRMGDTFAEGESAERPVHDVFVSRFYMDRYPVYKWLWEIVAAWAATNGYDISPGSATIKGVDHPAVDVSWYEAVKWCNARSQMEGLTPCYYIDPIFFNVYKIGNLNLSNTWVKWDANGYRLPTEAEWEKAARGGASGYRFPWADNTIRHGRANYNAGGGWSYDLSNGAGYHPAYTNGGEPYTSPVDAFTPNGYGLYDMAGNVWEWCWDWYTGYGSSPVADPQGPISGTERVRRGGSWFNVAIVTQCALRSSLNPGSEHAFIGFRCARGL